MTTAEQIRVDVRHPLEPLMPLLTDTLPEQGTAPVDCPRLPAADEVVAHTPLNCLLREVSGPEHQSVVTDGRLLLRLPRRGVLLRVALRRTSLLGAHRFIGPVSEQRGSVWTELDWRRLHTPPTVSSRQSRCKIMRAGISVCSGTQRTRQPRTPYRPRSFGTSSTPRAFKQLPVLAEIRPAPDRGRPFLTDVRISHQHGRFRLEFSNDRPQAVREVGQFPRRQRGDDLRLGSVEDRIKLFHQGRASWSEL